MNTLSEIINLRKNPVVFDRLGKFILFLNWKVCQRSIVRKALSNRVINHRDNGAIWEKHFKSVSEETFLSTYKLTFVRNPFDRAVSAFCYLQRKGVIDQQYTFSKFCVEVLDNKGVTFDQHFSPQIDSGIFYNNKFIVDFIGRFETLNKDWEKVAAIIDAPSKLPHSNRTPRKAGCYADYYTQAAKNVIQRLYQEDIDILEYSFE